MLHKRGNHVKFIQIDTYITHYLKTPPIFKN